MGDRFAINRRADREWSVCREALLEDGDQITVGAESVRVLYGDILGASAPSRSLSDPVANTQLAGVVGGPVATVPTKVASPVGEFASEAVFLPLLDEPSRKWIKACSSLRSARHSS